MYIVANNRWDVVKVHYKLQFYHPIFWWSFMLYTCIYNIVSCQPCHWSTTVHVEAISERKFFYWLLLYMCIYSTFAQFCHPISDSYSCYMYIYLYPLPYCKVNNECRSKQVATLMHIVNNFNVSIPAIMWGTTIAALTNQNASKKRAYLWHMFVDGVNEGQRTWGDLRQHVPVDLLLHVAILLRRERKVVEQHLKPLLGIVHAEIVKRCPISCPGQLPVLKARHINDMDARLSLGVVRRRGKESSIDEHH